MSNKNPFELRTEVLAMAKDYMDKQQELNIQLAQKAFDEALAAQKVSTDAWKSYVPSMYSIEDLMKKAQELYGFVSKKD